jgi:hypothetical protein
MTIQVETPRAEDLISVGSRISWAAILGGGLVALAICFMLTTLGAAVGLTMADQVGAKTLQINALAWGIGIFVVSVFVGGVMTSAFTVGENKVEAIFYGVIMWAFVVGVSLCLGASGMRTASNGLVGMAQIAQGTVTPEWESAARTAGVPAETIEDWRRKATTTMNDPQTQKEIKETAKKISWFTFGGTWLSMFAAAIGAYVGAGPTFRIITVPMHGSRF